MWNIWKNLEYYESELLKLLNKYSKYTQPSIHSTNMNTVFYGELVAGTLLGE